MAARTEKWHLCHHEVFCILYYYLQAELSVDGSLEYSEL